MADKKPQDQDAELFGIDELDEGSLEEAAGGMREAPSLNEGCENNGCPGSENVSGCSNTSCLV